MARHAEQRLADATLQPVRAGNTAKHRPMRHVVKAGHRKIVVAPRDLVKAATIHVVATAHRATAHRAVARLRQVVATLVHRVRHLEPAEAKAIAALHPRVAAVATAAGVAVAAAVAPEVADQAMADVVAPAATVVVKVTAHRAHAGASVVSRRRGGAAKVVMATVPVAIRAAAMGLATAAATVAHLRRARLTAVATTQAARTVRRAPAAVAVAGATAMA